MDWLFQAFSFFGTPPGMNLIGTIAAMGIVLWDWRIMLATLFVVQFGVAAATVKFQQLPPEWATVMIGIMGLCCLILLLSAQHIKLRTSIAQAGSWPLRAMLVLLFYMGWRLVAVNVRLPEFDPALTELFTWLGLCVLMILGLSENPLTTAIALLLWFAPVQAVVAGLLGIPPLIALVGILQLALALACSYLVLVEQAPAENAVLTDITFPGESGVLTIPRALEPTPTFGEEAWAWLRPRLKDLPMRLPAHWPTRWQLPSGAEAESLEPQFAKPAAAPPAAPPTNSATDSATNPGGDAPRPMLARRRP